METNGRTDGGRTQPLLELTPQGGQLKTQVYECKSCRNMFRRSQDHVNLMKKKKENSVLHKHIETKHTVDEEVEFEMKLAGSFKTPLQRIVNEGVRISRRDEKQLMNTKIEFFKPSVKRKSMA